MASTHALPASPISPEEQIERELHSATATISLDGLLMHRIRGAAATELPRRNMRTRLEEALWPLYGGKPEWLKREESQAH